MKLHPAQVSRRNTFTGYGEGYVMVNGARHERSLIVLPDRLIVDWGVFDVADLGAPDLAGIAEWKPEVVLLGTGETLRFPATAVMAALSSTGIGVDVMDTRAACRTYNILSEEGRNVAAALILPRPLP